MKLNIHETHDRYKHFVKQDFSISECVQDLINKRPFGNYPFYIFAHARTEEDGVTKRMIWQPRLTKPKSQTNSMLFKGYPGSDNVAVFWIIPSEELITIDLFDDKGNFIGRRYKTIDELRQNKMFENKITLESSIDYIYNRKKLDKAEDDDLSDVQIDGIYKELAIQANYDKLMNNAFKLG
jgi:hypothetical protein